MSAAYDKIDINHRVYRGFNIKTTDPYGLWKIETFDGKAIPELNQSYTMVSTACKDIDTYLKTLPSKIGKKSKVN